jgi:hypothetical protein
LYLRFLTDPGDGCIGAVRPWRVERSGHRSDRGHRARHYYQNITNGRNILLADNFTLRPTTILELRYSFTRHYENQTGDPRQIGFDITSLGFPASLAAQQVYQVYNDIPLINFDNARPVLVPIGIPLSSSPA